ncbi:hypothetical protein LTR92_007046 [Exophiala xenobiotica]|nr:hypothetical protein LTR92_007046 [Exophiala xenobiotica]KAK5401004.1 hypothetical protein LTR79_001523 [Exophiala xenobiotica]KAK5408933.1 hypothetical protein LTR90_009056 [Exophiala xenobiotica]KAK5488774.1 hypothetical protein LTR26_004090 [Exophiala xenobiotica]KAK5506774.1 hypothetical protein LTR83_001327 [Exophiala xenobiotica]
MFENCFPNTLDTTVKWFSGSDGHYQSFIIAGDMDAAWTRDNLWQIQPYASLLSVDSAIKKLWLGVINLHALFISQAPYANSFQPPRNSGISPVADHVVDMGQDIVKPPVDPDVAFEGKYALDGLAAFLRISNTYVQQTNDNSIIDRQWLTALTAILTVLYEQSQSTFDERGNLREPCYSFQRPSTASMKSVYNGPDQPPNGGAGNAVKGDTGLIKSAFRASDDATVFPFHIPSNAFIAVELARTAEIIPAIDPQLADECSSLSRRITDGIYTHGVVNHALYGKVFAYEVDGYGSHLIMDDASPPSLLSLPYLGFIDVSDDLYQSTRQMILSREGNPYYVVGSELEGQGSPHIDLKTMWPIGTIMQILTSNNDDEIRLCLGMLKKSSAGLGLMHEGVDVNDCTKFLRTWYAWGNSAFGEAIIDLAKRKPEILFGSGGKEKDNTVLKL